MTEQVVDSLPKDIEDYYSFSGDIDRIVSVVRIGGTTIIEFKKSKIRHIWKDGKLVEKQA